MENYQEVEMFHHGNISVAVDGLCFILDRQSPDGNVFFPLDRFMSSYLIFVTIYGCGEREPRGLPRAVNSPTQALKTT